MTHKNDDYAKMRTSQINAILKNKQLTPMEIQTYNAELFELTMLTTMRDGMEFRIVNPKDFETLVRVESKLRPATTIYGMAKNNIHIITWSYATMIYFTGREYAQVYAASFIPHNKPQPAIPNDRLMSATKALLESFVDNYETDCRNHGMSPADTSREIAFLLSNIFQPGDLKVLGYGQYEVDTQPTKMTQPRIVIFRSADCAYNSDIDMVLNVKNFDEKFHDHAKTAIRAWHNSTDVYQEFIIRYLTNIGYCVAQIECDTITDYT